MKITNTLGVLVKMPKLNNETLDEQCKRIYELETKGKSTIEDEDISYIQELIIDYYDKYVVTRKDVYEIVITSQKTDDIVNEFIPIGDDLTFDITTMDDFEEVASIQETLYSKLIEIETK